MCIYRTAAVAALNLAFWTAAGSADGLSLAPCSDERFGERAECGVLSVPEDRSRPDGRRVDLRIAVLRAAEPRGREPVFMLAGGPGQAATDLAGLALRPLAAVNRTRDFVLADQRGTGGSNPLHCLNGSDRRPQAAFGGLFVPDRFATCIEEFEARADLAFYNTPAVVADLEEVRTRLGYGRVVIWGGSGGTRTGLVWMRRHPERIAAAVLDGVTPTSFRAPSGMARGAHTALERVLEDCADQEACRSAFPTLEADYRKLLWLFEGGPVSTHVTREDGTEVPVEMSRGDFTYALRAMLYSSRRIRQLPKLIHETASQGDVGAFAQALWQRDVALRPTLALGVHFAVYCTEDMPFIDPRRIGDLTDGTFLGTYLLDQYGAICDLWPAEPLPRDYVEPTVADVPTLVLSGYYDPSTPALLGDEVHRHLPRSVHIVARDEAHGAGFGCARPALIHVLESASLEGMPSVCDDAGPIVFETG